jgi:hypothetical protein
VQTGDFAMVLRSALAKAIFSWSLALGGSKEVAFE